MAEVALPDHPVGTEFEEFVTAFMQCSGHFIERNLHERAPGDICELDVVLADHKSEGGSITLVEVKSGKWGLRDLFTLRGKMQYLGVENAALVTLGLHDRQELRQHVADKVGISLSFVETHEQAAQVLKELLGEIAFPNSYIEMWRYSYWLERCLLTSLRELRKRNDEREGPKAVWAYHQALQTNVFQLDMLHRTNRVYSLFSANHLISAKWAH